MRSPAPGQPEVMPKRSFTLTHGHPPGPLPKDVLL